ncbi:MAG: TetR/AcrR family transcriptional regulator, partial [Marmoricola sp.]
MTGPVHPGRVYSGLSTAERDAERRRRLLGAGLDLIGTRGYAGTSVERLCTTAKVSTRHFYQLYDNKESAFLDLYGSITARSLRAAAESLAASSGEPMTVRVPAAFSAYIVPMVEDVRVTRIAFVEIMAVSPRIEESRLAFRESLVELVVAEGSAAVARGEIADRDFRFAALALAGSANAIVYDWALRPDR